MLNTKFLHLLILILSQLYLTGTDYQNTSKISRSDFRNISFDNRISIGDLIEEQDYESKLISLFGQHANKECFSNPMTEYGCIIDYNGFQLIFDYTNVLTKLTLNNSNKSLVYKGKRLIPGMTLFELKSIFRESYDNRYSVSTKGGTVTKNIIKVEVESFGDGESILFYYNTSSNSITEISIIIPPEV